MRLRSTYSPNEIKQDRTDEIMWNWLKQSCKNGPWFSGKLRSRAGWLAGSLLLRIVIPFLKPGPGVQCNTGLEGCTLRKCVVWFQVKSKSFQVFIHLKLQQQWEWQQIRMCILCLNEAESEAEVVQVTLHVLPVGVFTGIVPWARSLNSHLSQLRDYCFQVELAV